MTADGGHRQIIKVGMETVSTPRPTPCICLFVCFIIPDSAYSEARFHVGTFTRSLGRASEAAAVPPSLPALAHQTSPRALRAERQKAKSVSTGKNPHSVLPPEQIVPLSIKRFHTNVLDNFRDHLRRKVLQEPCQPQKGLVTQKYHI